MRKNQKCDATAGRLLPLLAALCLCVTTAAAQTAEKSEPTAAQRAEAERMRRELAAALGDSFEVAGGRLARRSNWHGGQLYWLARLRAERPGEYRVTYKYAYTDRARPEDPLYDFVEHETFVRVGPRGCERRPRRNFICVGDAIILPVLVGEHTGHTFALAARPFPPADPSVEESLREMETAGLHREPVPNPAERFVKYLGSRAHYSPHRAPGYTVTFEATFEAVAPGAFNLAVTAGPQAPGRAADAVAVPVVVVGRGAPVTVLSSKDDVHGYAERFSSRGGGTSYLTTPVVMQVGERLALRYLSYSRRGRSAGGESRLAIEAGVVDRPPVITLLPFDFDPARDYNEWLAEFLPPRAMMRP